MSSAPRRAENERLVQEFLKQPTKISRRAFLRTSSAAAVALGMSFAAPVKAMTGGRAMMMGHTGSSGGVVVNATVSSSANNLDFRTLILAAGWNGTSVVTATVTINAAVWVGSSSTATAAFTVTGSFPTGSVLNLINNGHISGAGGKGGDGGIFGDVGGGAGGPALYVSIPVNVTNNGYIWGGGGGGSGGYYRDWWGTSFADFGGGGGGGTVVGGKGLASSYSGYSGTATAGGAGAYGGAGGNPGPGVAGGCGSSYSFYRSYTPGGGGSPGYAGGTGGYSCYSPVPGGAAGNYIVGNAYVTWVATGTRLGGVS